MRTASIMQLDTDTWPFDRFGDLIENLASEARLLARGTQRSTPNIPQVGLDEVGVNRWLEGAAAHLGLEVEALDASYAEVESMLRSGGPLILQLPGNERRLVALLRASRQRVLLLCPDLGLRWRSLEALRSALCDPIEAPLSESVDTLLHDAQVPQERVNRARRALLSEQLGAVRIQAGWMLRLSPKAGVTSQLSYHGILRPVSLLIGMYLVQQILSILSWVVIGRGIFQGNFELGWMIAWGILLLSTIPVQLIVSDGQGELSLAVGTLFKQRLLYGVLKLEPEEIRHQGIGQFLGRVMESEAVEMLVLSGGFSAVLSIIELILAGAILAQGAGGLIQAGLLGFCVLLAGILLWRYYRFSRIWYQVYSEMTNGLVEGMVGHRTRLVQEDPDRWHEREDQILDRYLKLSQQMDHIGIQLEALVSRGWTFVGLASIAYPFITGSSSIQSLAIALGGVLYASQALGKLVGGSQSMIGLIIAWQQVGPLFNAAQRKDDLATLDFISLRSDKPAIGSNQWTVEPSQDGAEQPLLIARNLVFRYLPLGRPVIQDVSLEIFPGDRILLEGPSGGGKSTLAALLTGLRKPESGSLLLFGVDQQIIGSQEWRRRIAMAPQFQENHVFTETFGFNLLMGRRWPATQKDLQEAEEICRELGLGKVLDSMPSGFQQMLGESGWQLSHGERSRLYIARTLLQNADLVLLDESFAALDPENLQQALKCVLNRARSLLVIAHP